MPIGWINFRFARVTEECFAFFGIGTIFLPADTIVIIEHFDEVYLEYGCYANCPETTFLHIPYQYLEEAKNEY